MCPCDTIEDVRHTLLLLVAACVAAAQSPDEDFHVYRDAPRLLLTTQRQRLLERERERNSPRWQAFDGWIQSGAPVPEPGFAWGLHYRITHQNASGRKAIEWALANDDLRQLALVYDWCLPLLTPSEADRLVAKLKAALAKPGTKLPEQAARALAAIALADTLPDAGDAMLRDLVGWWRKQAPAPREELYPLMEFLHVVRDNTKVDLRQALADYFTNLPLEYIASFYPAPFPGPDNDYRIPVYTGAGEPNLDASARARAAGLALAALDTNAVNYQFAQGMLMNDRFMLRGPLGAPYEFLWANPYQPGLAYQTLPLVFHDATNGHLFARTSWEDDATWLGYVDGALQLFRGDAVQTLRPGAAIAPIKVGDAVLTRPTDPASVHVHLDAGMLIVLGLKPNAEYGVEIDDRELDFSTTDSAGTLVVTAGEETDAGVWIRPHGVN